MGCSPLGSSYFLVHGILQAGILEWVTISSSGHLPDRGMEPASSALEGRFFTTEPPGKPLSVQWSQIKSWRQFRVEQKRIILLLCQAKGDTPGSCLEKLCLVFWNLFKEDLGQDDMWRDEVGSHKLPG